MARVRSRDRRSSFGSLVHQPPTVFSCRSYVSLGADCRDGVWIFEGPYFPAFAFVTLPHRSSYGTYVSLDTDYRNGVWIFEGPYFPAFAFCHLAPTGPPT